MTAFSVSPYRVMVQKAQASGFQGTFYKDELVAALQLLREHLTAQENKEAAVAALRDHFETCIAWYCSDWDVPYSRPAMMHVQYPYGSSVKVQHRDDVTCIGWAHRGESGELLSAYNRTPLDPDAWIVVEERGN